MVATTLRAGSVAIISYATDALAGSPNGGDVIRFVLLEPIGAGTQIFFSDRNWNGTSFTAGAGEGTFTFTASADMAAGTVVTISAAQLQAAGIDLSDAGETVYAYQGPNADAPATFLFAADIADGNFVFEAGKLLNTGLTSGLNAVALAGDQGVYQGQGTQVPNTQLADIVNTSRWYTSDNNDIGGTGYDDRIIVERSGPLNAGDMQLFGAMNGGGQSDAILRIDNDEGANIGSNLARLMRDNPAFVALEDIAFDLESGVWFAVMNEGTDITRIVRGNISELFNANQAAVFTTVFEYDNAAGDSNDDKFIQGIEIDKASNRIFFTLGDILSGHNFMSVDYNGGSLRDWGPIDLTFDNSIGFAGGIEDFVIDTAGNTAYFTYVLVDVTQTPVTTGHNYVVRLTAPLNAAAPNPAVENYAIIDLGMPADGNLAAGHLDPAQGSVRGIDYDPGENAIWFVTGRLDANGTGGIFKYDLDTGVLTEVWEQPSNNAHNTPQAFPTTLLHDIEVDSIGGRYYVTDQASTDVTAAHDGTATDENGGNIWSGSLTGTGAPTLFMKIYEPTANGSVKGMEINYAPTLAAATSANGAVTEASSALNSGETARVAVINSITVNDVDTTAIQGATIAISTGFQSGANQDRLTINGTTTGTVDGIAYSYDAVTGVMGLTGGRSFAAYQSVLALVRFSTSGDNITSFGEANSRTISFSVHDGLSWSDPATATVAVTGINDAPVNTVGGAMNFTEDTAANAVTGISISDVDANPATQAVTVTLSVANGSLTIRTDVAGGITGAMITGGANGTGLIAITATQNQINATLASPLGLTYTPNGNFNGADSLTVVTNDAGFSGTDPGLTGTATTEQDSDAKSLNVANVNDAPTVVDATQDSPAILEDVPFTNLNAPTVATLFGTSFSDALDDQDQGGLNPTGTPGDTLAGIAITTNGSGATGQWQYWNGASWVDIGAASQSAAKTLTAATLLRFNPAQDYNGAAPTLTAHLIESGGPAITNGATVNLSAGGATGGATVYSTGTVVLSQAVTPVNDAPTSTSLNGDVVTWTEGAALPVFLDLGINATVADVDSANFAGGTLSVAITGGLVAGQDQLVIRTSGTVSFNATGVFVNGIQIATYTGAGAGGGPLVFTFDADATPAAVAELLRAVAYTNSGGDNPTGGSRTISWTLVDGDGTANSGQDTLQLTSTVNVVPVNDAPAGADNTLTLNEDATRVLAQSDFGYSDVDGNAFAGVVITTLPANGTLLLNGVAVAFGTFITAAQINGNELVFQPGADENGVGYTSFTFQVRDNGGTANAGQDTDQTPNTISFDVTAVNDAPVVTIPPTPPKAVFAASDNLTGDEMWVTDGTEAGTTLVRDIRPGGPGSSPLGFTQLGDNFLFRAYEDATGFELYRTDGTAAGTTLVKDIFPGVSGSNPNDLIQLGDKILFRAADGINGTELWVTDGTEAGTTLLKDIRPGSGSSGLGEFVRLGDKVLFNANDGTNGSELWISDGTEAGTVLVKDITPGSGSSIPQVFAVLGDKVVFTATDPTNGTELWISDGTTAGTVLLKDITPGASGSAPQDFTLLGDKLVFRAADPVNGQELWITDGTPAGTVLVKDISPGLNASSPQDFVELGGKLLFQATDGTNGPELWVTDGTEAGTMLLKDINPGVNGSLPAELTRIGDKVLFRASDGTNSFELWVTDGTAAGTVLLKDIHPGAATGFPRNLALFGDKVLFDATNAPNANEPWISDGTEAGTKLLKDITPGAFSSFPRYFTALVPSPDYTENGAPVAIAANLLVSDIDNPTLASAQVAIGAGFIANADALTIGGASNGTTGPGGAIAFSYDAATGVMALTGAASLADYQAALRQVSFSSSSDNPGTSRSVAFTVNDGTLNSAVATAALTIAAVDDAAVANADTAATGENATVAITVLANDVDPDGPPLAVTHIAGQAVSVGGSVTLASGATVTLNANGTVTYDPNGKFNHLVSPTKAAATGASNGSATDSFTYTLVGGATAGVTVTVNGVDSPDDRLQGTAGSDTITGTPLDDLFMLHEGGEDSVAGGDGDDGFYMGTALSSGDALVGGAGNDQVGLQGSYGASGAPYIFDANNFSGIEMLVLLPGNDARFGNGSGNSYSYFLKTVDGNVASGERFAVSFNTLRVGENVSFDGSAETDGYFLTFGGLGNDTLIGGQQDDGFFFGFGRWGAGDSVDGQGGNLDQLGLQGVYTGASAITFGAGQIANIEMIVLLSGGDTRFGSGGAPYGYDITMNDANVANGATMFISSTTLTAAETLTFNGVAETDGRFVVYGGAGNDALTGGAGNDEIRGAGGNDTIIGGLGADTLTGGAGDDSFAYLSAADSTAASMDRILDFGAGDRIDLSAIDADGNAGNGNTAFTYIGNSAFTNVAGQLRAFLDGGVWKVEGDIDGNGIADLVIEVTTTGGHELVTTDFWL